MDAVSCYQIHYVHNNTCNKNTLCNDRNVLSCGIKGLPDEWCRYDYIQIVALAERPHDPSGEGGENLVADERQSAEEKGFGCIRGSAHEMDLRKSNARRAPMTRTPRSSNGSIGAALFNAGLLPHL